MAKYVGGEFIIESDSDGIKVTKNCEHGAQEVFSWKALEEDWVCRRPSGWIDANNPPAEGQLCIYGQPGKGSLACGVYTDAVGFCQLEAGGEIDYWMPLPSAPEVEE